MLTRRPSCLVWYRFAAKPARGPSARWPDYDTRYDFSARSRPSPAHRHLVPRLRASRRPFGAGRAAQAHRLRRAAEQAVRPVQRAGLAADVPGQRGQGLRAAVPAHPRAACGTAPTSWTCPTCPSCFVMQSPAGERDGARPGPAVHRASPPAWSTCTTPEELRCGHRARARPRPVRARGLPDHAADA